MFSRPLRALRAACLSVYVALTNIPGGGLLTGFAMRREQKGFFPFACVSPLFPTSPPPRPLEVRPQDRPSSQLACCRCRRPAPTLPSAPSEAPSSRADRLSGGCGSRRDDRARACALSRAQSAQPAGKIAMTGSEQIILVRSLGPSSPRPVLSPACAPPAAQSPVRLGPALAAQGCWP